MPDTGEQLRDTVRRELTIRLRELHLRAAARLAARAALAISGCVAASLLMLVHVPRLWFDAQADSGVSIAIGAAAGLALLWLRRSRSGRPTLTDAAMWVDVTGDGKAALVTALQAGHGDRFALPLYREGLRELRQASKRQASPVLSLPLLLAAPAMTLAAALLLIASVAQAPAVASAPAPQPKPSRAWSAIDVGAERAAADAEAVQDAMRLQKAAAAMRQQATAVRAAATPEQAQLALEQAKSALRDAASDQPDSLLTRAMAAVPQTGGESDEHRKAAAAALEEIAARLEDRVGKGEAGTSDAGRHGEYRNPVEAEVKWATLPPMLFGGEVTSTEMAGQSPARRALAARAQQAMR